MKHLSRLIALSQTAQEPTLASIPRILLRTVMRTLMRVTLVLASIAFALVILLLSLSLFFATWPSVHRR